MPVPSGTRLGPYEILAPLGAGAMGEVYRARDSRLGRDVALKLLPPAMAADAERVARFEHEARTVAGLNHPNIVTLYSVEDDAGTHFLTMELVEGRGLDKHVTPEGLPIERVLALGVAIAEALSAAHEKGVVHRDLKPANVMLTSDGRVKVLDFGLAKFTGAAPDTGGGLDATQLATMAAPLSSHGQVVGTVPYMAPEQVRGEAVDSRTDLFALGIMLYELTTGRRPFQGATLGMVSSAILRDAPSSPASARADVPTDLERIISRCLEKDPRARFQTALDVANELRRVRMTRDAAPVILKAPPVPSTPLLGRDSMLAAALQQLASGARVLTVTGYGGTGKTRFAIELFRRVAAEYPGGAAFVSLAAVTSAAAVLPTVATALAIAQAHGRSALEALAAVIGDRRVLLVLDNLEQVLEAAEELAQLSARCSGLAIVATSRAPLKIGAETEFSLPPLDLPAADASLEAMRASPAVVLFQQRAEKVKPGFALSQANAAAVGAICRRLDGLPLALELAAARVRILEPAALLQRLDGALDLLTSGDRDLPLRQRTLRATISWSYSLLDAAEQKLLRQLSSFHEGWTLEAMEQVCFEESQQAFALDRFESLVEKGLVRVMSGGERYALLETIRAFAAEQLHATGETSVQRDMHADYFQLVARSIARDIRTPAQLAGMDRGRRDYANLMAAIQWRLVGARLGDTQALEQGLLTCGYMDWYWHVTGQHLTARASLDEMLALAQHQSASRGRGLALLANGMVSTTTGEWERSLSEWRAAFLDGETAGDPEIAAEGIMGVAYCSLSMGRMEDAQVAVSDAIARSRAGGFDFLLGLSLAIQAMVRFVGGDVDAGIALIDEARVIQKRQQDYEIGGVTLSFLAQMILAKGDPARALEIYAQALAELRLVGDLPEVARVQCEMGWTWLAVRDAAAAQHSFVQAVHTYDSVGSPRGTGLALLGLAAVEAAAGRNERAVAIAAAADALSKRAGVVIDHPMDPGLAGRIEALKASIPRAQLAGLVAGASALSPAAVLLMVGADRP